MKCANCGTESNGKFCPSCGASLTARQCSECGADLVAGARFCTRCGAAAGGAAPNPPGGRQAARGGARSGSAGNPNLPWYIAGGVLLLLLLILIVPMFTDNGDAGPQAPFSGGAVTPGTPPPLTGTPREQADRLFDRIMTAAERGDTAEARRFTPMAIDAYGMAAPLDADGLYHLAVVHVVAGDPDAARETAERLLATRNTHLLGLAVAGEASLAAGDTAAARGYYGRLLEAYEAEVSQQLPEYQAHARSLPEFRATAQRITAG